MLNVDIKNETIGIPISSFDYKVVISCILLSEVLHAAANWLVVNVSVRPSVGLLAARSVSMFD